MKKKPKSLGEIAYYAFWKNIKNHRPWEEIPKSMQECYEREAKAVERAVVRKNRDYIIQLEGCLEDSNGILSQVTGDLYAYAQAQIDDNNKELK